MTSKSSRKAFRTNYNSYKSQLVFTGESRAHQSFKDECDINILLAGYKNAKLPAVIPAGNYGDFSEVVDFRSAHDAIQQARESFATLPSRVRERFHNDPALFLEFAENPQNGQELVRMGLATQILNAEAPGAAGEESPKPAPKQKAPKKDSEE